MWGNYTTYTLIDEDMNEFHKPSIIEWENEIIPLQGSFQPMISAAEILGSNSFSMILILIRFTSS